MTIGRSGRRRTSSCAVRMPTGPAPTITTGAVSAWVRRAASGLRLCAVVAKRVPKKCAHTPRSQRDTWAPLPVPASRPGTTLCRGLLTCQQPACQRPGDWSKYLNRLLKRPVLLAVRRRDQVELLDVGAVQRGP